ncbi:N-6 DNA methylase [Pseudomonas asiatica]|uniref:N-6 DNA methylase n=1 Tax=Pseudomonas asiatica TaxID=2219225 RepID=UPI0021F7955F|nr:N-6 DNA methylase [Pseudomonas asiatica]UYP82989.1 N-6 DNA methylase [Pseudomonas asiatica]
MLSPPGSLSDPLGRYYTKETISKLLVSELSEIAPKLVLDLGCGDGALSRAAASRWVDALYVTVDIDSKPDFLSKDKTARPVKHLHHHADALSPDLIASIGITPESVDLALCNPPFIKQKWQAGYDSIVRSAGLNIDIKTIRHASAEFIFIAQNLASLKPGGQLGLIVPDGFVSGEKNKSLRQAILNENSIDTVIKLPRNMFIGTEAQAHIIIITKNGNPGNPIKVKNFPDVENDTHTILISATDAIKTLDYDYYSAPLPKKRKSIVQLKDLDCEITRGRLNSKEARESEFKVLHTTDLRPLETTISLDDVHDFNSSSTVLAEAGDILLARVGRDLHTRVCMVTSGRMPITDCIYRIRLPVGYRDRFFNFLTSDEGRHFLKSRAHGVSAKHLPRDYLLELPIY